ncbi:MAG: hypothetical protein EOP86_21870 [Verrucomicrobiaceae bacterium]|nr:MAG: hypothetical protein EOP86_21870 [Verrucomicrobiaceae bacterium]
MFDPTPAEIIEDINHLAVTFYERLTGTVLPLSTQMHGITGDRNKTLAWDLACDAALHLTDHDPEALVDEESERNACTDFSAAWKARRSAA